MHLFNLILNSGLSNMRILDLGGPLPLHLWKITLKHLEILHWREDGGGGSSFIMHVLL